MERWQNSSFEEKVDLDTFDVYSNEGVQKLNSGKGKSLSEALLFAEHGENMLCTKIVLNARNNFCTQHVLPRFELGIFIYWTCNSMNNLSSYCGLVDEKIRDLPVQHLSAAKILTQSAIPDSRTTY